MPGMKKVTASREENTAYMNQVLPVKDSFDMIQRDLYIGERAASFYFIDGFMKDETMLKIMDSFMKIKKKRCRGTLPSLQDPAFLMWK